MEPCKHNEHYNKTYTRLLWHKWNIITRSIYLSDETGHQKVSAASSLVSRSVFWRCNESSKLWLSVKVTWQALKVRARLTTNTARTHISTEVRKMGRQWVCCVSACVSVCVCVYVWDECIVKIAPSQLRSGSLDSSLPQSGLKKKKKKKGCTSQIFAAKSRLQPTEAELWHLPPPLFSVRWRYSVMVIHWQLCSSSSSSSYLPSSIHTEKTESEIKQIKPCWAADRAESFWNTLTLRGSRLTASQDSDFFLCCLCVIFCMWTAIT